jgi:hypothetical protein
MTFLVHVAIMKTENSAQGSKYKSYDPGVSVRHAASLGNWFPTFRKNLSPSFSFTGLVSHTRN